MAITFSPARGIFFFPIPYSLLPLPCSSPPRVQQKFNSPKFSLTPTRHPPTPSPHKNPSPRSLEPTMSQPGLFRAKCGPIWVRFGLFWVRTRLFRVDSGLSRAKIALIWAPVSSSRAPSTPGNCAKTSPPSLRAQSHLPHPAFPKSHKI